jgi:DNA-directed RNA polymerase specialized sigma24 family protein
VHLTNPQIKIILNGCRLNKRVAQRELYRHYYGYAMSIAFRYVNNCDNAVEIINDAFLKVFKDLKNLVSHFDNTVASFTAELKKAVTNACIDYREKYSIKEMAISDPGQVVTW